MGSSTGRWSLRAGLVTNQKRSALREGLGHCLHLMEPEARNCSQMSSEQHWALGPPVAPLLAALPRSPPSTGLRLSLPCEGGDGGEVQRPQGTLEGMVAFLLTKIGKSFT